MARKLRLAGLDVSEKCPKRMFNGPCGGMDRGLCELGGGCVWHMAYARMKTKGRLSQFAKVRLQY